LSNTKVTKRKGERTKLIELEMIKQLSPKTWKKYRGLLEIF
jgi:hypothetical protein